MAALKPKLLATEDTEDTEKVAAEPAPDRIEGFRLGVADR